MKAQFKFLTPPLTICLLALSSLFSSCNNSNEWWNQICNASNEEIANLEIGTTKDVIVNGLIHKVRLIGKNHDILANESREVKVRTTWEFINPICDKNGYSLATFWDDLNVNGSGNNHNFLNSTLRFAIDGSVFDGVKPTSATWYSIDLNNKSNEYTKPVIDMLPSGLVSCMKLVEKKVHIASGAADEGYTESWDEQNNETKNWNTKLFIPSITEVSTSGKVSETDYKDGHTYEFYSSIQSDSERVKHQIKGKEGSNKGTCNIFINDSTRKFTIDSTHKITSAARNFAGYEDNGEDIGCNHWLRSPRWNDGSGVPKITDGDAYYLNSSGEMAFSQTNEYALPVTPCFCL